ncbi:MAG: DUF1376 domain-containing protein [Sedimentisphaerales bacterium]|nr:DUF1376 domain-containing protein [Sedimentisphaerales bacterium]
MVIRNTPAFQCYPKDFLADPVVMFWDMEQFGAYCKLLFYLWENGGSMEVDFAVMCKLWNCRTRKKAEKLWSKIKVTFVEKNGVVTHDYLVREMQKQAASRDRRRAAGCKGAQSRWGVDGNAISSGGDLSGEKNGSSSSISSSASFSTSVNNTLTGVDEVDRLNNSVVSKPTGNVDDGDHPKVDAVDGDNGPAEDCGGGVGAVDGLALIKTMLAMEGAELGQVVKSWLSANGLQMGDLKKYHFHQWKQALSSHGLDKCLAYIERIRATSPGWIISRMNKDAANAPEKNLQRHGIAGNGKATAGKAGVRHDGQAVDWGSVRSAGAVGGYQAEEEAGA